LKKKKNTHLRFYESAHCYLSMLSSLKFAMDSRTVLVGDVREYSTRAAEDKVIQTCRLNVTRDSHPVVAFKLFCKLPKD